MKSTVVITVRIPAHWMGAIEAARREGMRTKAGQVRLWLREGLMKEGRLDGPTTPWSQPEPPVESNS